jgi:hypothetical protein
MNTYLDETNSILSDLMEGDNPFPDLSLWVDFGRLAAFRQPSGADGSIQRVSLKVYSALTNFTKDVLVTTRPTLLFPGMNLIGVVNPVIRKRFRVPELSVWGVFDVSPSK